MLKSFEFSTTDELNKLRNNSSFHRKQIKKDLNGNEDDTSSFGYLFKMPLSSLTSDKIRVLKKELFQTESDLNAIRESQPEELWLSDLDRLAHYL